MNHKKQKKTGEPEPEPEPTNVASAAASRRRHRLDLVEDLLLPDLHVVGSAGRSTTLPASARGAPRPRDPPRATEIHWEEEEVRVPLLSGRWHY